MTRRERRALLRTAKNRSPAELAETLRTSIHVYEHMGWSNETTKQERKKLAWLYSQYPELELQEVLT